MVIENIIIRQGVRVFILIDRSQNISKVVRDEPKKCRRGKLKRTAGSGTALLVERV
jgi:hypothetical protein